MIITDRGGVIGHHGHIALGAAVASPTSSSSSSRIGVLGVVHFKQAEEGARRMDCRVSAARIFLQGRPEDGRSSQSSKLVAGDVRRAGDMTDSRAVHHPGAGIPEAREAWGPRSPSPCPSGMGAESIKEPSLNPPG